MLDDGCGDDFATGLGIAPVNGAHALEVLVAPQGNVEPAGNCIGILPEVKVECPLFGLGKLAVDYCDADGKLELLASRLERDGAFISSGCGVAGDVHAYPHGAGLAGLDLEFAGIYKPVGLHGDVLAYHLVEVSLYIVDGKALHAICRNLVLAAPELAGAYADDGLGACLEHGLGIKALTLPTLEDGGLDDRGGKGTGACGVYGAVLHVAQVFRTPLET